eukprot:3833487-Rhodomonas_salina.2
MDEVEQGDGELCSIPNARDRLRCSGPWDDTARARSFCTGHSSTGRAASTGSRWGVVIRQALAIFAPLIHLAGFRSNALDCPGWHFHPRSSAPSSRISGGGGIVRCDRAQVLEASLRIARVGFSFVQPVALVLNPAPGGVIVQLAVMWSQHTADSLFIAKVAVLALVQRGRLSQATTVVAARGKRLSVRGSAGLLRRGGQRAAWRARGSSGILLVHVSRAWKACCCVGIGLIGASLAFPAFSLFCVRLMLSC